MASKKSQKGPVFLRKQQPIFRPVKWGPADKINLFDNSPPNETGGYKNICENTLDQTIAPSFIEKAKNSWIQANYEILLNMRNIIFDSLEKVNNSEYINSLEFFTSFCDFVYRNGGKNSSSFIAELSPELEEEVNLYLNEREYK